MATELEDGMKQVEDMIGFEMPRGIVISFNSVHSSGYGLWNVQCSECGYVRQLSSGNIRRSSGACQKCCQKKFGAPRVDSEGKRRPEYVAWCGMRERCGYISGRSTYLEKGIKVYEGWLGPNGYDAFFEHLGPKPYDDYSLDRINNSGNYEPGNVRWASKSEQNSNKSDTHLVTIDGVSKPLSHWCLEYGIYAQAVHSRVKSGWDLISAITKPFKPLRPDVDSYYLTIASDVASRGTCIRREVGAVLVDINGYCISTGYNSVKPNIVHCHNKPCIGAFESPGCNLNLCDADHAEVVAISKCLDVKSIHTAYVTVSPCVSCVSRLLQTGCKRIVFIEEYPHLESKDLWISKGFEWVQKSHRTYVRRV